MNNYAYIDNQNLYFATKNAPEPWKVDMLRLRVYLKENRATETLHRCIKELHMIIIFI